MNEFCEGKHCGEPAIDQVRFDEWLCEQHYRDAVLWDEADNLNQMRED